MMAENTLAIKPQNDRDSSLLVMKFGFWLIRSMSDSNSSDVVWYLVRPLGYQWF